MKHKIAAITAAILILIVHPSFLTGDMHGKAAVSRGVADVEFVAWVTGPFSPNGISSGYDIDGTDLGIMFEFNNLLPSIAPRM